MKWYLRLLRWGWGACYCFTCAGNCKKQPLPLSRTRGHLAGRQLCDLVRGVVPEPLNPHPRERLIQGHAKGFPGRAQRGRHPCDAKPRTATTALRDRWVRKRCAVGRAPGQRRGRVKDNNRYLSRRAPLCGSKHRAPKQQRLNLIAPQSNLHRRPMLVNASKEKAPMCQKDYDMPSLAKPTRLYNAPKPYTNIIACELGDATNGGSLRRPETVDITMRMR